MKPERFNMIARSIDRQRETFGEDYDKVYALKLGASPEEIDEYRKATPKWTPDRLLYIYKRVEAEIRAEGLSIVAACRKIVKDGLWFERTENKGPKNGTKILHAPERYTVSSPEVVRDKYYDAKNLVESDEFLSDECEYWIEVFLESRRSGRKVNDVLMDEFPPHMRP